MGTGYTYSTGGSSSNFGHSIQYFFDWGDGTNSGWLPVGTTSASKSWNSPGSYTVKAQARCSTDTLVVSGWSPGLTVTISAPAESVSTPSTPGGPSSGITGTSYNYSTGGSSSNLGHSVQYFFDWGDGTNSGWLPVGQTSATKPWLSEGSFLVKAKARCSIHTDVESDWSVGLAVNIENDTRFSVCSLNSLPVFSWDVVEPLKSSQIQFSIDNNFISPIKVRVSGTEAIMTSATWKKILLLPGASGGSIYWRVVGTRSDNTTFESEVSSISIETPQPAGSPTISTTSRGSTPELSWENNCNTKFKVWFGSDEQFTKKTAFTFNIKDPNDNEGEFTKALTSGQWMAIRRVVKDVSGSTIYWYVESWDGVKRYTETEVMSFVLTD